MSITLVFGSYGGFYVSIEGSFRLCLGWVALTIYPFDLENAMQKIMDKNKKQD